MTAAATQVPDREALRLGATIMALREGRGLTRAELARGITTRLGKGASSRYIRYIETGQKRPGPVLCRQIADVLGVPLAAITVEDYEAIRDTAPAACRDGDAA